MDYYYLDQNGEAQGPFCEESLREMLRDGRLKADTLVAAKGDSRWQPLGYVLAGPDAALTPVAAADATSPWQYFAACFKTKYCCFSGRARRKEFWSFELFCFIVSIVLGVLDSALFSSADGQGIGLLSMLFSLASLLPALGVTVRRLHDTGRSAWWLLLLLLPIVGPLILLIFCCLDSRRGSNQYGPSPKYPRG